MVGGGNAIVVKLNTKKLQSLFMTQFVVRNADQTKKVTVKLMPKSKWIPGQGFHFVQPNGPIDHEANQKRMDILEERLQAAEIRFGMREGKSA